MAEKITLAGIIAEIKRINRKAKIERLVKEIPGLTYKQAIDILNK